MTAIVAACYKQGVLVGSESRAVSYSKRFGDITHEASDKIASLKLCCTVLGFAGEVGLASTFVPTNDKIKAMSLPEFIVLKMMYSREVSYDTVVECIRWFVNTLEFVGDRSPRTIDVVLGFGPSAPQVPTLFRICAKGPPWKSREIEPSSVCLGAGIWDHYYAEVMGHKDFFIAEDRERLVKLRAEGLIAPPMPQVAFDKRSDAEQWVRDVIKWCCTAFPMYCSGEIKITDSNTDLFKFSGE